MNKGSSDAAHTISRIIARFRRGTPRPTRADVEAAYHVLLGRPPENESAINHYLNAPSVAAMLHWIGSAAEFRRRVGTSPYYHYHSNLDVQAMIERHVHADRKPIPEHLVNFLGVAISTKVMPHLANRGGQLDEIPIPANHHADMSEWAAALRATELAQQTFTMIELGCGWGCWMNNTGVVAKRMGLDIHLIGIEGDEGHIAFAEECLATNGIAKNEYTLLRGIAAARGGYALFPRQDAAGGNWGLEPVFSASEENLLEAERTGQYDKLRMVPLAEAVGDHAAIDLLHVDIQGGEADLVHDTLDLLNARVAYILIGTHSREIEGRLMHDLLDSGWVLEIERPAIFRITPSGPQTTIDGVQAWRNPRLRPVTP